jgi:sulfonate transport system substrate-binding protein
MKRLAYSVVVGLMVLASVLAQPPRGAEGQQRKVVVRIGVQPFIIPSVIMRDQQTLEKKYGDRFEFRWLDMTHAAPVIEAMVAGELDLADGGSPPLIQARAAGHDIYAVGDTLGEVTGLVVRKDAGITTIRELKGRHLAFPGKLSWQFALLRMALEDVGLSVDDVRLSLARLPEMPLLFEKKAVDGFVGVDPFVSLVVFNGQGTILFRPSMKLTHKEGTIVGGNVAARGAFARQHPEAVTLYLKEFQATSRWMKENPREAGRLFEKILKGRVTEPLFMYMMAHGLTYFQNIKPRYEDMTDLVNLLNKYQITTIADVDGFVKGYVRPEFASW